jgi:hypothetical protein
VLEGHEREALSARTRAQQADAHAGVLVALALCVRLPHDAAGVELVHQALALAGLDAAVDAQEAHTVGGQHGTHLSSLVSVSWKGPPVLFG